MSATFPFEKGHFCDAETNKIAARPGSFAFKCGSTYRSLTK